MDKGQLLFPDEEEAKRCGKLGAFCISNYWDGNINLRPFEVEGRYRVDLGNGVDFIGTFDQVREVPIDWIQAHRPELVENGRLVEEFDAKAIVDLKTGFPTFDLRQLKEKPSLEEEMRWQHELHEDFQATAYTFLFERVTGKKPIGFCWYHLRSGRMFFTFREDRDYLTLYGAIHHYLDNLNSQSFPKHVGRHCRRCDYYKPCREDRHFLVSAPEDPVGVPGVPRLVPNLVVRSSHRQLRLKVKVPRIRREKPRVLTPVREPVRLPASPPWEMEER